MNQHIIRSVSHFTIRRLRKVRSVLGANITTGLVSAIHSEQTGMRCWPIYRCPTIAPLQRVQNAAARLIKDLAYTSTKSSDISTTRPPYLCIWCIQAAAHRICLVSWLPQRLRYSDLPTPIVTKRSPLDSSLANDVFHTSDPKLGMNCLYRSLGFNVPQSVQTLSEDNLCLNVRLLHSDQGWICQGVGGFDPSRTDGRPSYRKSENIRGL